MLVKDDLGKGYKYYNRVMQMVENQGVQARIPYDVEVY